LEENEMLIEGLDNRLLVVSASDSRHALHSTTLEDGTQVDVKEDLQQTTEHQVMAARLGDEALHASPRFYVTRVYDSSGIDIDPRDVKLPKQFNLKDGTVVGDYEILYGRTVN
jgi:hypothetical protein